MIRLLILASLAATPAGVSAQTVTSTTAPTSESRPSLSLDTPIEVIVADPRGRAVIDKRLPRLQAHESYELFKSMSLRDLQPMSGGLITDALLKDVETDLAALNKAPAK